MPQRPINLLHITVDQQHAALMNCAGSADMHTPVLDALAAEGARCTNHYTQSPICTPSRVTMLSGQYPHNHGYHAIGGPTPRTESYFHAAKRACHATAAIGKLHLPNNPRCWLQDCVDHLRDTLQGGDGSPQGSAYQAYLRRHSMQEFDDHRGMKELGDHPHHWDARPSHLPFEHCVEHWIADEATAFLDGLPDERPFTMHLSFPRPHHCITPDQRFWDLYDDDLPPPHHNDPADHRPPNFQDMVHYAREGGLPWGEEPKTWEAGIRRVWRGTRALVTQNDHCIGMVIEALRRIGRLDDTLIVFTSDHGCFHGIFGVGEKAPGIGSDAIGRVPFIVRGPGVPAGTVCDALTEHVDIAPTLAAAGGLGAMEAADGHDLLPLLRGEVTQLHREAVTEWPTSKAMRFGKWRFVHYHRDLYDGADVGELYDLEADPWETCNRYHDPACQEVVVEARRRLLEWLTETTRHTTAWPYFPDETAAFRCREGFTMATDGRARRAYQVPARLALEDGQIGAFAQVDYL